MHSVLRLLAASILLKGLFTLGGHTTSSLDMLLDAIRVVFGTTNRQLSMLDYGSQEIFDICVFLPGEQKFGFDCSLEDLLTVGQRYPLFRRYDYDPTSFAVKPFFEHLGFRHLSIDLNGRQGSIVLDARTDITRNITERFDVLVNHGFSEHVGEGDVRTLSNYTLYRSNV
jgi:hypothetical protein